MTTGIASGVVGLLDLGRPVRRVVRRTRAEVRGRFDDARFRRRALGVVVFVFAVLLLVPVFRLDALGSADPAFFATWQNDSEALVLGKIEAIRLGAPAGGDAFGLVQTLPDILAPRSVFDSLAHGGHPHVAGYGAYISQLGAQGWFFAGLYALGVNSIGALWTVESVLFAAALVGFALLLASVTRRSFAVLFLVTSIGSPWVVAAARNLYWVPWTWLLPACAAVWFIRAEGRRARTIALAGVVVAFAVRCSTGYEFLTSIVILAAGMPLLALVLQGRGTPRQAVRNAALIAAAAVAAFLVVLVAQMIAAGGGDLASGAAFVWHDATSRTYGGASTDPVEALSQAVSPMTVLGQYFFAWPTNVLSLGSGAPATVVFGPSTVWLLTSAAIAVVLVRAWRADRLWRRDAVVLLIALAIPLSWYVLAKAHSYVHRTIDFVLWYQLAIGALLWIVGAFAVPPVLQALRGVRRAGAPR